MPLGIARQDDDEAMRFRAAADYFYAIAGRARKAQLFVVLASALLAAYAISQPGLSYAAAFAGCALALLDSSCISPQLKLNRRKAAQCSELFDAYVFDSVRRARFAACPAYEEIAIAGGRRLADAAVAARLRGWYDTRLTVLEPTLAHLAAMQLNAAWDIALRAPYVRALIVGSTIVIVAAFFVFGLQHWPFDRIVTNVVTPLLPALLWLSREIADHIEALTRKTEFRRCLDNAWSRTISGPRADSLERDVDDLQSILFSYRITDVSVPGWLYLTKRDRLHSEMSALSQKLLKEAGELRNNGPNDGRSA